MRESIQIMLLLSKSNPIQSKKDSCLLWFKRFKQFIWILHILWGVKWVFGINATEKKILGFGIQLYHCHSVTPCSSSSATVVHTAVGYLEPALHLEPALPLLRSVSRRPHQARDLASRNPSEKDRSPPDLPM